MPAVLKHTTYQGFHRRRVQFVYMVEGYRVYFSGVERGTSTINAAEEVIQAICQTERIRWEDQIFYDVRTSKGYPGHRPEWCEVERLTVKETGGRIEVTQWQTVASAFDDAANNPDVLRVIPKDIVLAFLALVNLSEN